MGTGYVTICVDILVDLLRKVYKSASGPLDWVSAEVADPAKNPLQGERPRNNRRDSDDGGSGGGSAGTDGGSRQHQNHRTSGNTFYSSGKNNNRKSKGKVRSTGKSNTTAYRGSPGSSSSRDDAPWKVAAQSPVPSGRQVILNLLAVSIDTARFTELTGEPSIDRPLSTTLAHTRQATVDETAAVAAAAHVARVQRNYTHLDFGIVDPITALSFHASADSSEWTQQLTNSVKSAMAGTLGLCDDFCFDGLKP